MSAERQILPERVVTCCSPSVSSNEPAYIRPEFIRLPKAGTACPFTSLSRSTLNTYILPSKENGFKPPVKSYVLRQPGRLKGIRLIDFESLCFFIRKQGSNLSEREVPGKIVHLVTHRCTKEKGDSNAPTVGLETTTENALFSTFAASAIPSLPITFAGRTGTQTQPQN